MHANLVPALGRAQQYGADAWSDTPRSGASNRSTVAAGDARHNGAEVLEIEVCDSSVKRTFRIVFVECGHGTGGEVTVAANKEIAYEGKETQVSLRRQ
jgi:hypothetical protein